MAQKAATIATVPSPLPVVRLVDSDRDNLNDQASGRIIVDLLGGLHLQVGTSTLGPQDLGGAKPRHVLLALLLHRGAPVSMERLISLLWGESPPSTALGTLAAYVCVLRKTLEPGKAVQDSLITTVGGGYAIDMGRVDLDLVRYERLVSVALRTGTSAVEALPILREAMALGASPLLPEELDGEWLGDMRRMHTQQIHNDLVAAARKVAGLPCGSAERWARLALEGDPLDESAWFSLLANTEANGRHADGLKAYEECRRLFASELGCAPGPGLQELHARLLRGANENDQELSYLLDAVVRVYMASRLRAGSPVPVLARRRQTSGNNASVDQALRALHLLLQRVDDRFAHLAADRAV